MRLLPSLPFSARRGGGILHHKPMLLHKPEEVKRADDPNNLLFVHYDHVMDVVIPHDPRGDVYRIVRWHGVDVIADDRQ